LNIRLKLRASVKAGVGIVELVEAEALVADLAVHERVGEVGEVTRRLPDRRRGEDGGVEAHHVVSELHHGPPPCVLHVAKQKDTDGPVVVGGAEPAVDLRGPEDEAATLREVDDPVEQGGIGGRLGHGHRA
jgi:hypothetical protein